MITKEIFDNYKFSIKTEVKLYGEWHRVTEVDFEKGKIGTSEKGWYLDYQEFEDIRQQR